LRNVIGFAALAFASLTGATFADEPTHISSAGGEVVLPSEGDVYAYENYRYAAARRAGDYIYISGVVAGPRAGEATDVAGFKAQLRRAFQHLQSILKAAGADFKDVVMINSFHVWEGPDSSGTKAEHFEAVEDIMDEFMDKPWPAWTAVGTTSLLGERSSVEIQMIAYAPRH
jgi:enamine deaminase RidA (YjgF/YER057c/UK114 family)